MKLSASRRSSLLQKAEQFAGNLGEQATSYLLSRGISREVAEMFSFGYVPYGEENGGRLSIPYITPAGCVQIKYRCISVEHGDHKGVDCPKYLFEAGLGVHLYNARILIHAPELVVVTEGELDAAVVQAYTGIPAVGYPGVDTWAQQKHWPLCFEGVGDIAVVADGDKAGKDSANRVAGSIPGARVVTLGSGHKDANEFIAALGASAFMERVNR